MGEEAWAMVMVEWGPIIRVEMTPPGQREVAVARLGSYNFTPGGFGTCRPFSAPVSHTQATMYYCGVKDNSPPKMPMS